MGDIDDLNDAVEDLRKHVASDPALARLASEQFQMYRRGWKDGASVKVADVLRHCANGTKREDVPRYLHDWYERGYKDGREAYRQAIARAQAFTGHRVNILRACDTEDDQ